MSRADVGAGAAEPGGVAAPPSLENVRRAFAEALRAERGLATEGLTEALAAVPREAFLGPGPWLVFSQSGYESTPDDDPRRLYGSQVAVALDAPRLVNSGAPGIVSRMLDLLGPRPGERVAHVGCGSGYYTAVVAEVVGSGGRVAALELERRLARGAARSLHPWRHVEAVAADGTRHELGSCDAVLVTAGATHPHTRWLDALAPGGRLVVPLTAVAAPGVTARFGRNLAGRLLRVERVGDRWHARVSDGMGTSFCHGARDVPHERRLREALLRGDSGDVASLRRDPHAPDATCWLHGEEVCLSSRAP